MNEENKERVESSEELSEKEIQESTEHIEEMTEEVVAVSNSELDEEIENQTLEEEIDVENNDENEILKEVAEVAAVATSTQKIKKHIVAKQLVEEAKSIVDASDNEVNDCKALLENDLRDYQDAKRALKEGGLEDAKALLVELGHATMAELDASEEASFEIENEPDPLYIKDVNSGRFTGLILSVIAGIATLGGLVYLATEKLGMTLDLSKIPSNEAIDKISNWYSNIVSMGDNVQVGMGLIALIVFLVMFIVYALRVGTKGSSNLRFAESQMEKTHQYVEQKISCKQEMDRIDAHLNESIVLLKNYQILLNEQNGKLKRIIHFERKEAEEEGYHLSSIEEMKETQSLIENVQSFMSEPMTEEGKLSQEGILTLEQAKEKIEHFLRRFV